MKIKWIDIQACEWEITKTRFIECVVTPTNFTVEQKQPDWIHSETVIGVFVIRISQLKKMKTVFCKIYVYIFIRRGTCIKNGIFVSNQTFPHLPYIVISIR